jgi:hypothetical protein
MQRLRQPVSGMLSTKAQVKQWDEVERKMIVKRSDGYYVVSESKDKKGHHKNLGGPYSSKGRAKRRLQEVEYFKSHK